MKTRIYAFRTVHFEDGCSVLIYNDRDEALEVLGGDVMEEAVPCWRMVCQEGFKLVFGFDPALESLYPLDVEIQK